MNTITRTAQWLYKALNLQEPTLPRILDTTVVMPVVDVIQGGAGDAPFRASPLFTHPASTTGTGYDLLEPDEDFGRLVLAMNTTTSAGWDPAAVLRIGLKDPVLTAVSLATYSVPAGMQSGMTAILGTHVPIIVPPRLGLQWVVPDTGAGQSVTTRIIYGEFRAGTKFW